MIDCCFECEERHTKCHSTCDRYKSATEKLAKEGKKRKQEIAVKVYQLEQKNKAIQIKRHHKSWKRGKNK